MEVAEAEELRYDDEGGAPPSTPPGPIAEADVETGSARVGASTFSSSSSRRPKKSSKSMLRGNTATSLGGSAERKQNTVYPELVSIMSSKKKSKSTVATYLQQRALGMMYISQKQLARRSEPSPHHLKSGRSAGMMRIGMLGGPSGQLSVTSAPSGALSARSGPSGMTSGPSGGMLSVRSGPSRLLSMRRSGPSGMLPESSAVSQALSTLGLPAAWLERDDATFRMMQADVKSWMVAERLHAMLAASIQIRYIPIV